MVLRWIGLQKVVQNQVQGNGAALARYQGMAEQVAVLAAVPGSVNCLIAM